MTDVLARPPAATVEQAGGKVRTGTPVEHLLVCGDTGSRAHGRAQSCSVPATSSWPPRLRFGLPARRQMPPDSEATSSAVFPKV
jgi:hypothetical protein